MTAPVPAVDMSPAAIAERIAEVGQLYRVCMSLASAVPLPPKLAAADETESLALPKP